MVTVRNIIDPNGIENVIKTLASGAIKVEVYQGDSRVKLYYVGGATQDQEGTYMLLANSRTGENFKQPYITYIPGFNGYLSTRYFVKEDEWRDRTIMQYYPYALRSVQVIYPQAADSSFRINILGRNHFTMANPITNQPIAHFDTIALKQYLTYYQSVSWDVTVETPKKDSILHSSPIAQISVKDTAGKSTDIKLFLKKAPANVVNKYGRDFKYDPDQLYALINDKDFVIVQYYVFGKMMQRLSYFFQHS